MKWLQDLLGTGDIVVSSLERDHAPSAADIHAANFSRPWTDGEIADLLGKDNVRGFGAHARTVRQRAMTGFVLVRAAADEAEVLTIAVSPEWHGYGVGRKLMDRVLAHAHRERLASIFLEVEETNAPARALYAKLGFVAVGERPDYYAGAAGDRTRAIVMRRHVRRIDRRR